MVGRWGSATLAIVLLAAACTRGDDVLRSADATTVPPAATSPDPTANTGSTSPPSSPRSTVPATTPATVPPTSAPPTATSAPAAPTTTVVVNLPEPGPMPAAAFAVVDSDLVEIDPSTGAIRRTIVEFFEGDGAFRGDLELSANRTAAYYTESFEDAWFSCESSIGSIGEVDLDTGERLAVVEGWSPSLSPDGRRLAFVTSGVCVPDPEAPEIWVLTPGDRAVVLDLETGGRVEVTTATSPVSYDDPNAVDWVAFHPSGDLFVGIAAGDVHRVRGDAPGVVQDGEVMAGGSGLLPVAVYDDVFVGLDVGEEGETSLVAVDLANGATSQLWTSEVLFAASGEPGGNLLVVDSTASGSSSDGNLTVLALDAFVTDLAW